MTLREYIDLFRQHYPDASVSEITKLVNRGMREFLNKARLYESSWNISTVVGQRWYALPDTIINVKRVDLDGTEIPRAIFTPDTQDLT